MKTHSFALCFKGSATAPAGNPPTASVECRTQATMFTTGFRADGVASDRIVKGDGADAVFRSSVTMRNDSQFDERGTIDYGHGNSVSFETPAPGILTPSAMPGVSHGAVVWRITGGTGAYTGATGYITSNFTIHTDGVVVDHQFAVIFSQ